MSGNDDDRPDDEDGMTAVNPTSMLKTEDADEEDDEEEDATSGLYSCVQMIRKRHSAKFATLLNIIKSDRTRFAQILRQHSSSNNRQLAFKF